VTGDEQGIRDRYRAIAIEWVEAQGDPKKANRIFAKHHAFYKEIRDDATGRQAIESLLDDPAPGVRVLAATHSLLFSPARGQQVLEDLERAGGAFAVDAKYTLITFRSGRLNLDW
jgi:hypothetical protein